MFIYLFGFLISLLFLWLAQKKAKTEKTKIIFILLAVLPLFLLSALRYDVGTDYIKRYTNDYLAMAQGENISNLEIGFKFIDYLCLLVTKQPYLLFWMTSLIILGIFFTIMCQQSKDICLSATIFFLAGYFFGSLNLVRQYIAIGFLLIAYQFLLKENKKQSYIGFAIFTILAFFMHSSSIVGVILILLTQKVFVNVKWVLPVSIILLLLNENLIQLLAPIIGKTRFNVYLTGNMAKGELSILNILENVLIYVWMYAIFYLKKKNGEELKKEAILLLNIQGVALLTTVAGACHMLFSRIALYFVVFQILAIPYYISIMPLSKIKEIIKDKWKKEIKEETIKQITIVVLIIGFISMFTYTNILNNDNGVLPYKTIFTVDK